jgi:alginate O-acetyltransferase complex protein AlgI
MLFNNFIFFAFLALFTLLLIPGNRNNRKITLLIASYFFYGYWNWKFTLLLLWSTLIDYYCARIIYSIPPRKASNQKFCGGPGGSYSKAPPGRRRQWLLAFSVINNLLILGFFKYFNFFADSFSQLLGSLGMEAGFVTLNIVLPVGISFYTFQTMSYTIDVYREQLKPTASFIDFANYVSFFPQLVAGPIERATRLLPQLEKFSGFVKSGLRPGLTLMLMGYIKKVLISDSIAPLIDRIFDNYASLDSLSLCCGLVLFSLQIYFDFSGYSDIARGVARLFGIELMINFNQPYFAMNPVDFWRRWHISLSTWLRDYLFMPVAYRVMRFTDHSFIVSVLPRLAPRQNISYGFAMFVTMFLGGLWHGASWNFVLWGSLHGLYLILYRILKPRSKKKSKKSLAITNVVGVFKALLMYLLVTLTWLPFRAPNFAVTGDYLQRLFMWTLPLDYAYLWLVLLLLAVMIVLDLPAYRFGTHLYLLKWPLWFQNALLFAGYLAIIIVMILHINTVRPFIYFQF